MDRIYEDTIMLTIAEVLRLPEMAGAHVAAGHDGLHKPVAWVHIASGADAYEWVNGGELVLTTDLNLPPDDAERRRYIEQMAARGVVGLAVTIGRAIPRLSASLCQTADGLAFPLIEIPYQTRFVDVARAANQRIAQEPLALYERALHIHRVLSQLVLDGGDLQQLAETMARLLGQSISIETERFDALAAFNVGAYDEARRYTLDKGRTDPRLVSALEARGILPQIRATLRPAAIGQMADVGLEMERILAPIVVHGEIYGYLWIIADDRPLSDLDRMAIESGATIAALIMLHREAVQDAEASLKGGLLAGLLEGVQRGSEGALIDGALRYGVDLDADYALLLADMPLTERGRAAQWTRRINRLAESERWRAVVGGFAGQVAAVANADAPLEKMADSIRGALNGARVAISGVVCGAAGAVSAYQQARDALIIARRLSLPSPIVRFADLGYLHTLYRAGAESLASNPFVPALRALRCDDGADLFRTLEIYLDSGGSGVATAEALSIHRSTLNYRLDQLKARLRVRLDDAQTRTNLQIALKLLRLFEDG
jgi:purine catabolism regulator